MCEETLAASAILAYRGKLVKCLRQNCSFT